MLETVMVPVETLFAYENNAKIHTQKQISHIANSIRDFGFNDPVGVWTRDDGTIEIVTGHGAVQAAKSLGMREVPCNFLDHMTDEERRAYCHVHNQTQLETGFEVESLIEDMDNLDIDWDEYGFAGYTYEDVPDDDEPELDIVRCTASKGDVWELGSKRIVCGGCDDQDM